MEQATLPHREDRNNELSGKQLTIHLKHQQGTPAQLTGLNAEYGAVFFSVRFV
jgi:hypothetical protein